MFNPTELSFSRSLNLNVPKGARTDKGLAKVSFGSPQLYSVTISGLMFDTYESGENVIDKHIENFRQAVEFMDSQERPPIYLLTGASRNIYVAWLRRCPVISPCFWLMVLLFVPL